MQAPSFEDFLVQCEQQDIALRPEVAELPADRSYFYACHSPSRMLRAVTVAGAILRQDAGVELANGPIELSKDLSKSVLATTLGNMVNGSVQQLTPPADIIDFPSVPGHGINACKSAELKFLDTVEALRDGTAQCQIIGDAKPLLLRKGRKDGERSALSLRQLSIEGIPYPAGSIFNVELDDTKPDRNPFVVEAVDIERVAGLGFMRLSAFAVGYTEGVRNFQDLFLHNAIGRSAILGRTTLRRMAKVVQKAHVPATS